MEVLYKDTVEYCKTREQFGQPIGTFQLMQGKVADMYTDKFVRLKFLIFPLPYHRNAHFAAIVSVTISWKYDQCVAGW